ncbi:hypothetical protein HH303_17190 [Rhodospirillaceae bacterium KN72]|uniref:Uncharacterized protein n=1 Tax=Pacificispira spongiicola TaxID=2729598 RepID=A0A7Y0E2X0_9PROT|nr:hypothetical protein [Pacificispira spongiicola]NMM46229.1 hypothetical protein [Pacificispira spongiicola]
MAAHYRSFQDRGVYVGFLGRTVEMVRCRTPRDPEMDDFEAIVPNFGGDMGRVSNDLVMPFAAIADWSDLLGRDKLLYERIEASYHEKEGHLDPITIRDMRLSADLEAGEERDKRIAENEIAIAKSDVQSAFLEILAMFGRKFAERMGEPELRGVSRSVLLSLNEESPKDMLRLVRIIVGAVVAGTSISRDELQGRLDMLSDYASPICSLVTEDKTRSVGFLSRQMQLLEKLRSGVSTYCSIQRPDEIMEAGRLIDFNLTTFIDYAMERANTIKSAVLDSRYYLNDEKYQTLLNLIRQERIKISFALDGWAGHATRWLSCDDDDIAARNAVMLFILRQMPAPPKELDDFVERRFGGENLLSMRGRVVKEMHSWFDDRIDQEIYRRVMQVRTGVDPYAALLEDDDPQVAKAVKKALRASK